MSVADQNDDLFRHDVYEQSYQKITGLKAKLPEEVVVSLAKEVLARLSGHIRAKPVSEVVISEALVLELAESLVSADAKAAAAVITRERTTRHRDAAVYVSYLAAAARRLGDWWNEDKVTFAQVTIGSGRIYAILRSLKPVLEQETRTATAKSALFATVPGEDHTLGIRMATDMLRTNGWEIDLLLGSDHDALVERIAQSGQPIIGLSGGGEHVLPNLAKLIVAIRIWAPKALIMVSGQVVEDSRDLVDLMAPDAMASDFDTANARLNELWELARTQ